jgi:hypothetical protein
MSNPGLHKRKKIPEIDDITGAVTDPHHNSAVDVYVKKICR